jgi:hypothetical protein
LAIIWPWKFQFTRDATVMVGWVEQQHAEPSQMSRELALQLQQSFSQNQKVLDRMFWNYRAAVVFLALGDTHLPVRPERTLTVADESQQQPSPPAEKPAEPPAQSEPAPEPSAPEPPAPRLPNSSVTAYRSDDRRYRDDRPA